WRPTKLLMIVLFTLQTICAGGIVWMERRGLMVTALRLFFIQNSCPICSTVV
ncbi:hypothetical protein M514_25931, partial [Trichuris suis]